MAKVLVAMSGGVDSSVTAFLLKQQGHDCAGATMRLCTPELLDQPLASDDIADARAVCEKLGMPFFEVEAAKEFERDVVDRFVHSYETGETPNPCIVCNRYLKFGLLWDFAKEHGFDYIATGHYAQIERDEDGHVWLAKGADASKDQSYVLYSIAPDVLAHVLLPLGGMSKPEVRAIAEREGLVTAHKSDSEDICFIPDGYYVGFLKRYAGVNPEPGPIVNSAGKVIGQHAGAIAYTVGQRKGLGVGGLGKPFYVCGKDMAANAVIAGPVEELFANQLVARDWNWLSDATDGPFEAMVRTRYHQQEQAATLQTQPDGRMLVRFAEPQRALAPGQAVVAYAGDRVLGGGTIC